MTLLSLAVVAALVAMQPAKPATKPQPSKPATTTGAQKPTVFKVRVVVASVGLLKEQCEAGKFNGVDILVDSVETENEPYHCPGKKLLPHKEAHYEPLTRVMLSYKAQDSVVWYSDTHEFGIASIVPHEDKAPKLAPKNPFGSLAIPTLKPTKSFESGPIIESAVNHRYKIHLSIGKRIIDPDVWCNP
jgi:hypothetical protein